MNRRSFLAGMGCTPLIPTVTSCAKQQTIAEVPYGVIPKTTLGKTGMQVSRLGFGSHLKEELVKHQDIRNRMIRTAFDRGVNFFDVYDHMGCNQFKPMNDTIHGFRKDVHISLVSIKKTPELQDEIDGTLKAFRTDYIDLFRLYSVDDDRINIIEKNRKAGKIRAIGVVEHNVGAINGFIDRYGDTLDFVMIIFNFHHNKALLFKEQRDPAFTNDYSNMFPRIRRLNLGVVGMKPMGSDAMIDLAKEKHFFREKSANIAQAMLRYVYQQPEIHTTIPAMNSIGELSVNLESIYRPSLSPEGKRLLDRLSVTAASMKSAYLPSRYRFLENWASRTS
ncbi:MAG: aldo/keto reductase [Candidatus Latescibacteria bacterium]|nr:aldo/keto reductase [Candidatus Latescibacterota bacterium]